MNDAQKQMPQYQSHKKVWALKIAALEHTGTPDQESDGSLLMSSDEEGFAPIKLDADFVRKHQPKVGGYCVVYAGGYKSFSPADAFEGGYTLISG
jgi:hypothetical protein